jgi:low temperature requirement protein LtrA
VRCGRYVRAWFALRSLRNLLVGFIAGFSASVVTWLLSLLVDDSRYQLAVCMLALLIDTGTPFLLLPCQLKVCTHT